VGSIVTTGAAIKFTALIIQASGGNIIMALLLIIIASLFLGMGAPVTAAYLIVAVVSAGALVKLGIPLLVAHLICFWYAIDSEVTPPVCITSYAAAGISGSKAWPTAIQGWKAAKGLYIIPVLAATTPLVPVTWDKATGTDIFLAIFTGALGLIASSMVLERYFLKKLNLVETFLMGISCVLLLLPYFSADVIGIGLFFVLLGLFYLIDRKILPPLFGSVKGLKWEIEQ
jgi:TRAP-type uncharacterized transport system fused permease subunit